MLEFKIRLEQPEDYLETEIVTREAFWNHFSPGCDEHYLLHIMRNCPDFIPELDFVAVLDEKIIGNVVSIKSIIKGDDGKEYELLGLGPISVLPEYQGMGVGIRTPDDMFAVALHICGLYENSLSGLKGRYIEHPVYAVDELEAAEFDKLFPEKKKVSGTPSQMKFNQIVAMRKNAVDTTGIQ